MKYELKKSADGTFTMYSYEFDECYHSLRDGAFKEAYYKHIEPAFSLVSKKRLRILDICFGLGINTLTTLYYFFEKQNRVKHIEIFSPEFDIDLIKNLTNFSYPPKLLKYKDVIESLVKEGVYKNENIFIELFIGDAREYIKGLRDIDIVYQDAFSPKKNPILWTVEYFKDIYNLLNEEGVITTYSIATPVRLALYEAGFYLYEKEIEGVKKITIASKRRLDLKEIDMFLKAKRATSKPLRDSYINKEKLWQKRS
jgi:tRNA U34 5-methylaminomethyl-2-thiouridine-forming methyltransferase MnmC